VKYLIDTNACICHMRAVARKDWTVRLAQLDPIEIAISTITKGELLFGVHRSQQPQLGLATLANLFGQLRSLPFDDAAAERYGLIRCDLANRGRLIGANDMLIAAIAMAHGLAVITHNVSEFSRIPGLTIEDWEGG
jgi:tRNA(fMet)-specific endonuclease VapC